MLPDPSQIAVDEDKHHKHYRYNGDNPKYGAKSRLLGTISSVTLVSYVAVVAVVALFGVWLFHSDIPPVTPARSWGLISGDSTHYVASLLERELIRRGFRVTTMRSVPNDDFPLDAYILLNPDELAEDTPRLPPPNKLILFAAAPTEATFALSSSSTPGTPTRAYERALLRARFVLVHDVDNIEVAKSIVRPYVYVSHMPIGAMSHNVLAKYLATRPNVLGPRTPPPVSAAKSRSVLSDSRGPIKLWDVLAFAAADEGLKRGSTSRRSQMLAQIKKSFTIKISHNAAYLTASAVHARVVLFVLADVEDPLDYVIIHELISLGVTVVAENARNREQYPELEEVVRYFEAESAESMVAAVEHAVHTPLSTDAHQSVVQNSEKRFQFMFDRFLVGTGLVALDNITSVDLYLPKSFENVVLSTAEFNRRRRRFFHNMPSNFYFTLYDGFFYKPSWIGCALSHSMLARHAIAMNRKTLLVVEDDVLFPPQFTQQWKKIKDFLGTLPHWDIFAGLIADVTPETKVLDVLFYTDFMFVIVDRSTSMVFNYYNRRALEILSKWDVNDRNDQTNTIDRYLNRQNMTIVTTLPYFVDHQQGAQSTLWKIQSSHYSAWIARSQELLMSKMIDFVVARRAAEFATDPAPQNPN